EEVDAVWTFGGRWDPRTIPPVLPFPSMPYPENGARLVDPAGVTLRWTPGRNARAQRVYFGWQFRGEHDEYDTGPLEPGKTYQWRVDTVTADSIVEGPLWSFRADPRTVR